MLRTVQEIGESEIRLNKAISYCALLWAITCLFMLVSLSASAQVPAVNSGTAIYPTSGTVGQVLSATTGTITPGILIAGACGSGTVAVANSTTSMTVDVSANTYPGDGVVAFGYVSANGTVTVKVCAIVGLTPGASTYNVKVLN